MAIDKIFKSSNVDDLADNILSEVDDFMVSVDKMQQRKVAGNVQKVIQAFKQIETDLQDRYDNVTDVIEKRVSTIKDGRDGLNGTDGRNGRDGKPGRDGINGKQGAPGTPGTDGVDGLDGVSVTNANIDFDGSLVISLSSGQQINVGEIVPPELERQLVELRQGGGSAGSSGDVMGPTASTDNAIVRFDGTTGKLVQNSVVTIADTTGNMAGVGSLAVGTTLGVTGVSTLTAGAVIQGLTVGKGAGAIATNTALGASALAINTTGLQNTAVGSGVLSVNLDGDESTGLGYRALYGNTSGDQNTAVGSEALTANNSGSRNTGVGYGALYTSTTAVDNTAVGWASLYLNALGGSQNTAVGAQALEDNNTGASNTGLGYQSLGDNNAGSQNTGTGRQALRFNTSGADNVADGYRALYSNTTASNSTAVGSQAGFYSLGASNTAVGYQAYLGVSTTTTGTFNTTIGAGSGSALTSGGKNVILGSYTGNQGSLDIRTASNYIVLSDGDGNPLISTNSTRSVALNGAVPQTGTGITFPATQSASTNANTLDDYEEGTTTLTLDGSTTSPTTPVTVSAFYTKIGKQVVIEFRFESVDTTGATGNIKITGLPFAIDATTTPMGVVSISSLGIIVPVLRGRYIFGTTAIALMSAIDVTSPIPMIAGAGKYVFGSLTYFI